MSMLNESDWETGMDYDPCVHHDHCAMCGVCGDENELVQERLAGSIIKPPFECLPCRVKGIQEDTK